MNAFSARNPPEHYVITSVQNQCSDVDFQKPFAAMDSLESFDVVLRFRWISALVVLMHFCWHTYTALLLMYLYRKWHPRWTWNVSIVFVGLANSSWWPMEKELFLLCFKIETEGTWILTRTHFSITSLSLQCTYRKQAKISKSSLALQSHYKGL